MDLPDLRLRSFSAALTVPGTHFSRYWPELRASIEDAAREQLANDLRDAGEPVSPLLLVHWFRVTRPASGAATKLELIGDDTVVAADDELICEATASVVWPANITSA
jgi:hypothetical protein